MTDPQQQYQQPYPPQQAAYPGYAQQPGYGDIAPYQGLPQPGYAQAGYGVDPATGLPLSDKSKIAAGLLQLFLGGFGVGRFYLGYGTIGGVQLGIHILGWFFFFLGFLTFGIGMLVAMVLWMGGGIWALIDAIMMFTGGVRDAQGRPLRS